MRFSARTALEFKRWRHGDQVSGARIWLFRLASGQLVAALATDASCGLRDLIDLLEDCYYGDLLAGGEPITERRWCIVARRRRHRT